MWTQAATAAVAAQAAMYSAFTLQAEIPWAYSETNADIPFTLSPRLKINITSSGSEWDVTTLIIDTGSCGFLISAADLPGWSKEETKNAEKGWMFLSSSKLLYSGHWLTRDVYFLSGKEPVKATFPMLAVVTKTECPKYDKTKDGPNCPAPEGEPQQMPSGIRNFGVAFGRLEDGQPQGTPDKNAFLNVKTIGKTSTENNSKFRNGYIVTKQGITIGLTGANTANMEFTKLDRRPGSTDSRDWAQVQSCMSVDGMSCVTGPALLDTGIAQMYMTLPLGTKVNRKEDSPVLVDGSKVRVDVGPKSKYFATLDFTVGDVEAERTGTAPKEVRVTLADVNKNPPHVNTGRHIFRKYKAAFDAAGGYFGMGPA